MGEKSASKKEKSIKKKKKSKRKRDEGLDHDERKLKKKVQDSKLGTKKMKAGKDHKKVKDKEHDKNKKRKDKKKKNKEHGKNKKHKDEKNASESKSHKIKKSHKKKPTLSRSAPIPTKSMMGEDCLHIWPTVRQHVLSYNIDCFSNINKRMLLKGDVTKMESRIGLLMDQSNTHNDIFLSSSEDENYRDEVLTSNKNKNNIKSSCGIKVVPIQTVVTNIQHNQALSR